MRGAVPAPSRAQSQCIPKALSAWPIDSGHNSRPGLVRDRCLRRDQADREPAVADYLGLRIETVSRWLKALEAAGAIETGPDRIISVKDVHALERLT